MSDASASMELEDDSLSAGLDSIAARFAQIASQINGQFAAANSQLSRTAGQVRAVGSSSPALATVGAALRAVATGGRIVATALSGIVTTASRIAPLIKYVPDSMGKWVPQVKAAAAEYVNLAAKVGLVTKSAAALSGRLSILQAGFGALELREVGASKAAAVFGAAGALALSRVISLSRAAVGAVGSIGSRLSGLGSGIASRIGGAFSSLGRTGLMFGSMAAPLAAMGLALGPIGVAAVGVAAGFSAIKKGVTAAAETQQLQTSFITLLGSADAARKRMAELSKFAQETPFEIPGVTRASRVLEVLTHGALSTGAGLRLVGDAAAVAGQPIEEIAMHVGRIFSGMMNGAPAGESLQRLQELGLISTETRTRLEALQKAGQKGGGVWAIAAGDLMRFSGEMQRQSLTWNGLMSNLHDAIGGVFRALGQPIITALTPYFAKLIDLVSSLTKYAEHFGNVIAGWGALIAEIISEGKVGEALSRVSKIAFMEAVNWLVKSFVGAGNVLVTLLAGAAREFVVILQAATTGQFWSGVGNLLKAAGLGLVSILLEGVSRVLDTLRDLPKIGKAFGDAADVSHIQAGAASMAGGAMEAAAKAGNDLGPLFRQIGEDIKGIFSKAGAAFSEGQKSVGDVMDTDKARADFQKWLQPIAQAADKAIRAASAAAEQGGMPPPIGSTGDMLSGKGKADVAALQKIGGGGGFDISRADPLLSEARNQTSELQGLRKDVGKLIEATKAKVGARYGVPIFGGLGVG